MASQQPLSCPRCESLNTKFCYYNNYNLSQPRHFCKACRRYWTHGGSLRNIPVGGGSRKHPKRSPYFSAAVPASHASSSGASSPTQVAVVADQIAGRQGQKQRQDEDEDRVWSDVNVNEANCSFSSLLGVNTDRLNGYGFGLLPGFDEFGLGGPSADLVNGVSDTWHSVPGRAEIMDCFGWPDLSISVPSNDTLD